jgi:hypothetical protein
MPGNSSSSDSRAIANSSLAQIEGDVADAIPRLSAGQTSKMIKLLFGKLPISDQESLLREMEQAVYPIPVPRAGQVLGAIVRFLPNQREWTVGEVKGEVMKRGIKATPKDVYNAFGYLVRKGYINRVGPSRYLIVAALGNNTEKISSQ